MPMHLSSFAECRFRVRLGLKCLLMAGLLSTVGCLNAHPEPDIPVRSRFMKDGSCEVTVELDPRCFAANPIMEPYTLNKELAAWDGARKQALLDKAAETIKRYIEFQFEPSGKVEPQFVFEFTSLNEAALAKDDDPVVMTGKWKTASPQGATGWRIHATKETPFAIIFRNFLEGVEQKRFSVLFPGETSFLLNLTVAGK